MKVSIIILDKPDGGCTATLVFDPPLDPKAEPTAALLAANVCLDALRAEAELTLRQTLHRSAPPTGEAGA